MRNRSKKLRAPGFASGNKKSEYFFNIFGRLLTKFPVFDTLLFTPQKNEVMAL
jgi:hypothetical protein